MADVCIGLSGLQVAQRAIEVIGNNIANAATEGYHRQEAVIAPIPGDRASALKIGYGAQVLDVRRMMDFLLDREIRRQLPELGQVSQELTTLQTIENLLGEVSGEGLTTALSRFFAALRILASQPDNPALREEMVWAADSLASQFRTVGEALAGLVEHVVLEARNITDRINTLTAQIADMNRQAQDLYVRGLTDNNLMDLRDRAVTELAELAKTEVYNGDYNSYTVLVFGTVAVLGTSCTAIETGYCDAHNLGVSVKGVNHYDPTPRGGQLGALLALKNEILPRVTDQVDGIAREIIEQINRLHVEGTGTAGSFSKLTGWTVDTGLISGWDTEVLKGDLHLRVINTATGVITQYTVAIDPAAQTVANVAALLNAIPKLSASVAASRLTIEADAGFKFDFMPALPATPAASTLTGTAAPTISGVYTGSANQTFAFTVVGSGNVGVAPGLSIQVENEAGETVKTLNVGLGYAAGDRIEVSDGLYLSLSMGTLLDKEDFTVEALARSDPTGFLAAAGINTFFAGSTARSIRVEEALRQSPARVATTLGAGDVDNLNIRRMAALADEHIEALGGTTLGDSLRGLISNIGQWVALRRARQNGIEAVVQHLANRRDDTSGVDINEEAASLLIFERMFQGMAKYLATLDRTRQFLMEAI